MSILRCPFMTFMTGLSAMSYLIYLRSRKMLGFQGNSVLVGAVELGGTFMSVAIIEKIHDAKGKIKSLKILERQKFDTTTPQETLKHIIEFFKNKAIQEIGIASFGPLNLNKKSKTYGSITTTPKKGWQNFAILSQLQETFPKIKIFIDTDVNACAWAEFNKGKHDVNESIAYITVGTGVGVGLVVNHKTVHGLIHPEGGHMLIPNLDIKPNCPYHPNCPESFCTNHAIAKQLGKAITDLPNLEDSDPVFDQVAEGLAITCANICLLTSPEKIVLGGGVMNRKILYNKIRSRFTNLLNGYLDHPKIQQPELYISEPGLSQDTGLLGAAMLSSM